MQSKNFLAGREQELRDLIKHPRSIDLSRAACRGIDPDTYHPDGPLDELSVARCAGCPARMACLAYAIGIEDPGARAGWYGGLGPQDRSALLALVEVEAEPAAAYVSDDAALEAIRLREIGLTVNEIADRLACSRRTVQRYCRKMRHANDI